MKACYRNYLGPIVLMVTGLVMALLLSQAHSAPPPVQYARAGIADAGPDESDLRAQPDAAPPTNDGLGTSPSWTDILTIAGLLYGALNVIVAATPTKKDDAWLARWAQRLAFLAPKNVSGVFSLPGLRPRPNSEGV